MTSLSFSLILERIWAASLEVERPEDTMEMLPLDQQVRSAHQAHILCLAVSKAPGMQHWVEAEYFHFGWQ